MNIHSGLSLQSKQLIYRAIAPKVPQHLANNFKTPSSSNSEHMAEYLAKHYFSKTISDQPDVVKTYLASEEGAVDMSNQSSQRLQRFRSAIIPWLDDAKPLAGARILEIGCGTGSSTVAMAEQGAIVTGVDIDEASLKVARERCSQYGVDAEFHQANATELSSKFAGEKFDFIIYFACLEHMTHEERMSAMKNTWDMLPSGAFWCVIETPNRIWFYDHHTARLPFYMWLPDDLAYKYAKHSPRKSFNSAFNDDSEESFLHFLRAGRGVSYHEFDLTMGISEELDVVSSLASFNQGQSKIWEYVRKLSRSRNSQYEAFLRKVCPNMHPGFLDAALDLIIRKN
jgi:2-polyprenyl-3-methyl-5-hydroxy-6-metoxy-1,4-benzoquinol methylase